MLADDLKPNRLSRAKYTLIDWLKAYPEINVGMVAYTGTAHTIAPISEDNQTLQTLIPSLTPQIMPSFGSDPVKGFEKAIQLLEGAKINQGQILWVTDDLEPKELQPLQALVEQHDIQLHILAVGTANGGPILVPDYGLIKDEQGKIVLAQVPFNRLQTLAQKTNGAFTALGMDPIALQKLLPKTIYTTSDTQQTKNGDPSQQEEKQLATWLDEGLWLLVLILPLSALAYRRGWLLTILLSSTLTLSLSLWSDPSYADEETRSVKLFDVFKSPDQQGYEKWQKGDYSTAADRFEDPNWKGSSLYRLQKFKEARQQFSQDKSARGRFNEGNAYAQMGDLEKAKKQYQEAIKLDPSFASAQHNLNAIEQFEQQQKQSQQNPNKAQQNQPSDQEAGQGDQHNQQASEQQNAADSKQQQNPENKQQGNQNGAGSDSNQDNNAAKQQNGANSSNGKSDLNQPYRAEHQSENPTEGDAQSQQAQSDTSKEQATHNKTAPTDQQNNNQPAKAGNMKGQGDTRQSDNQPLGVTEDDAKLEQLANGASNDQKDQNQHPARKALTEQEQARQNWLNQIPDDPSLFLKRKFEHQIQQNQQPVEPKKIW